MNKKGFTLVELIVVVIIIGILATIAIPQYTKAIERARIGKAKIVDGLIRQAEKMYAAGNNEASIACADEAAINTNLGNYIELTDAVADTDWTYSVTGGTTTFKVTATRVGGTYTAQTMTLDQAGVWTSSHSLF